MKQRKRYEAVQSTMKHAYGISSIAMQYMRWDYLKFRQGGDDSLNSCPNLDEAALRAMKRCKAPWSMPSAYEALQSNISGGVYYFKFQQGGDAMPPSYSVRRGRCAPQSCARRDGVHPRVVQDGTACTPVKHTLLNIFTLIIHYSLFTNFPR